LKGFITDIAKVPGLVSMDRYQFKRSPEDPSRIVLDCRIAIFFKGPIDG